MCDLFLMVWRGSFFCSRDGLLVGITGMVHLYAPLGLSGRLWAEQLARRTLGRCDSTGPTHFLDLHRDLRMFGHTGTVLVRCSRLTSIGLREADNSQATCLETCLTSGSSPDRLPVYVPQVITPGTFNVSCACEPDKAVRLVSL
jgi:hypothetical protein